MSPEVECGQRQTAQEREEATTGKEHEDQKLLENSFCTFLLVSILERESRSRITLIVFENIINPNEDPY